MNPEVRKAMDEVFEKFDKMTDEEFFKELEDFGKQNAYSLFAEYAGPEISGCRQSVWARTFQWLEIKWHMLFN